MLRVQKSRVLYSSDDGSAEAFGPWEYHLVMGEPDEARPRMITLPRKIAIQLHRLLDSPDADVAARLDQLERDLQATAPKRESDLQASTSDDVHPRRQGRTNPRIRDLIEHVVVQEGAAERA